MRASWRTASREDLITEIERQQRENERLRRERERAEQERDRYRRERDRLRKKIERLEDELDAARRALHRQAAPFSRGQPKRPPRRPGRKAGAAYGRKAHRPPPAHVDRTYNAPLPACCPDCGDRLSLERHATQYQEDLPVVRPIVRAFQIAIGCCEACGRRIQGRHPLQTSDAIGAAAAQLGLPLRKIATLLRERFGLTITCGGLVHAVRRAARQAEPTYAALCATIRGSPVVNPDETGWRVDAHLQWLSGFATPDTTVYAIQAGRGFEEAAAVLGADFDGVLVRDGWAPYRRFTQAVHQTCLAHLLRRCRTLIRDQDERRFAPRVQAVLHQGLRIRDRWRRGAISAHGLAVARGHLENRLNRLIDQPGGRRIAQRFAAHLAIEYPAVFTFLLDPAIDATNFCCVPRSRSLRSRRRLGSSRITLAGSPDYRKRQH